MDLQTYGLRDEDNDKSISAFDVCSVRVFFQVAVRACWELEEGGGERKKLVSPKQVKAGGRRNR